MDLLQFILDGFNALFSLKGEATAFDYALRGVLRVTFSPQGVLGLGMAISLRAWRRAMAAADYGVEAWAIDRGLKGHAYVSRQLAGEKPIKTADQDAAPVEVRRWYHLFCLEELGVPATARTAADVLNHLERTA